MNYHSHTAKYKLLICLLIFSLPSFLAGCASTPGWPMENIGTAQFSGNTPKSGNILVLPTSETRKTCQKSPIACQTFATNIVYTINTNSAANAFLPQNHETMSIVHENRNMVKNEIERVNATYLLVWEVGVLDDRDAFSFRADAYSISTLKVIDIASNQNVVQLMKPYGLINPNTEDFVALAGETGKKLGGYLSPHLN